MFQEIYFVFFDEIINEILDIAEKNCDIYIYKTSMHQN
jgi:hypothetical protein